MLGRHSVSKRAAGTTESSEILQRDAPPSGFSYSVVGYTISTSLNVVAVTQGVMVARGTEFLVK